MAVDIKFLKDSGNPVHRVSALRWNLPGEESQELVVPGSAVFVGRDLCGSEHQVPIVGSLRADEALSIRNDVFGIVSQIVASASVVGLKLLQVPVEISGEGLALLTQRILKMFDAAENTRRHDSHLARFVNGAGDGVTQACERVPVILTKGLEYVAGQLDVLIDLVGDRGELSTDRQKRERRAQVLQNRCCLGARGWRPGCGRRTCHPA